MITAWVLYLNGADDRYFFQELNGSRFDDFTPEGWGLPKHCYIILVLQKAQFIDGWIAGERIKP